MLGPFHASSCTEGMGADVNWRIQCLGPIGNTTFIYFACNGTALGKGAHCNHSAPGVKGPLLTLVDSALRCVNVTLFTKVLFITTQCNSLYYIKRFKIFFFLSLLFPVVTWIWMISAKKNPVFHSLFIIGVRIEYWQLLPGAFLKLHWSGLCIVISQECLNCRGDFFISPYSALRNK